MMCGSVPLLLVALTTALAAPSPAFHDSDNSEQIIVPQKRAALVLDRLLIALQKALHEDSQQKAAPSREWPRTEPLRINMDNDGDMRDHYEEVRPLSFDLYEPVIAPTPPAPRHSDSVDTSGLQRRGQGGGRGRVLRCYFNAVTCF
ncbi:uncharacterized protein LOC106132079 isoform X1 [Amyelois transitella]|uniref:uncharacterized protein LOC106132079 isoform X1 n=1 Tax=Amyelois transitella TaxID=680683 RepID=UPI00067B1914|nr:uncharacterized protein LOC106132079 isoform X1 [Amyelois transitella]XP_060803443.1 uncharacterized protein LOC106132079 isoform X1 [Amyelois transitella]